MAISKIILNGVTQIDVTGVTTIESDVANNKVFIKADGTSSTGSYVAPTLITKSITANGTYDPADDNADGYSEVTVNVSGGGGAYAWAGPNATLYHTFSDVEYALEDTGYATWTPSTTATQILAIQTIDSQVTLPNCNSYVYYYVQTFDFVPAYLPGATLQAQIKRFCAMTIVPYGGIYSNSTNGAINYAAARASYGARVYKYYNTSGVETLNSNNGYGGYGVYPHALSSPQTTISGVSAKVTAKTSQVNALCLNSQFSTTAATELDQANSKFTFKTYIVRADRSVSAYASTPDETLYSILTS